MPKVKSLKICTAKYQKSRQHQYKNAKSHPISDKSLKICKHPNAKRVTSISKKMPKVITFPTNY
jgi:hypothetical protein